MKPHLRAYVEGSQAATAGDVVVGAGSGRGRFAIKAARQGARVVQVDTSPGQLAPALWGIEEACLSD